MASSLYAIEAWESFQRNVLQSDSGGICSHSFLLPAAIYFDLRTSCCTRISIDHGKASVPACYSDLAAHFSDCIHISGRKQEEVQKETGHVPSECVSLLNFFRNPPQKYFNLNDQICHLFHDHFYLTGRKEMKFHLNTFLPPTQLKFCCKGTKKILNTGSAIRNLFHSTNKNHAYHGSTKERHLNQTW